MLWGRSISAAGRCRCPVLYGQAGAPSSKPVKTLMLTKNQGIFSLSCTIYIAAAVLFFYYVLLFTHLGTYLHQINNQLSFDGN